MVLSDCTFGIRISVRISKIGPFAAVRGNLNLLAGVRKKVPSLTAITRSRHEAVLVPIGAVRRCGVPHSVNPPATSARMTCPPGERPRVRFGTAHSLPVSLWVLACLKSSSGVKRLP